MTETSTYDWTGNRTSSRDAYNYITSFARNHAGGVLVSEEQENPDGGTMVTEYYLDGNVKSVSGTGVHPSATDYRVEGNQRVTRSISGAVSASHPAASWVDAYTDMAGRVVKTVYPDDAEETVHYNAKGQAWKRVDADGLVTLVEYDGRGRTVRQAVDMNLNDVIDLNGSDRIMGMAYSVVNDGGQGAGERHKLGEPARAGDVVHDGAGRRRYTHNDGVSRRWYAGYPDRGGQPRTGVEASGCAGRSALEGDLYL